MSDDDGDRTVDPRYDPVFQRGFGGEVVEGLTRRPIARPQPELAPVIAPLRAEPSVSDAGSSSTAPDVIASSVGAPGLAVPSVAAPSGPSPAAPALPTRLTVPKAEVTAPDVAPAPEPVAQTESARPSRRPPWKNPFLIALLIVGIGLIGGALTLANNYAMHRGIGVDRTDDAYLFVVLTQYGAPTTAILGMATIIGVVFVFAIEWQRRGR